MKLFRGVLLVFSLITVTSLYADNCKGNACSVVYMDGAGKCTIVHNTSDRKVHVQLGAIGRDMNPKENWTVKNLDGTCLGVIVGNMTANYI